ncbi:MAG TPA: DEAD/DEAH box helicase [Blastocatellia bacterium]|nr:DEAD/DEAH box helicase [Blastocatellia bacterium]
MNSNQFSQMGLSAPLVDILNKIGITEPTEIQHKAIPHILAGRELLGSAETGSGKTAAFLLPIIERLKAPGAARALVLAPTRELALQIEKNAKILGRAARLKSVAVVGGANISSQIRALHTGVDIIIATPGRLNDLIERRAVSLRSIEIVVLDEADRMLDMGFLPQVKRIAEHIPSKRQMFLFSATISREVEKLAREMQTSPVRVHVARKTVTVSTLTQRVYPVLTHAKTPLLLELLKQNSEGSFIVFTRTRRGADRLARVLSVNQFKVATLHSDRTQSQRNAALESFRSGHARVLVATDVAARGIDVDDISHVVNYDVPATADDYIHRVGRTARAGRGGSAVTLVSPEEESVLSSIERATGQKFDRSGLKGFTDGRSERQITLAAEIAHLRSSGTRSFTPRRASR